MSKLKEKKVDRRIQKTKKALTEALINLILEKGYEKVTIQDIIDKANVGRSTFYIHYESKEQLLLDGHNNLNVPLFTNEINKEEDTNLISFESLFEHIEENKQLAKAMLGKKGGNMMTEFFKNNIALKIRKRYIVYFKKDIGGQKTLTFLSSAAGSAVVSLIISWIEDENPFTAKEISLRSQNLVIAVFDSVISKK